MAEADTLSTLSPKQVGEHLREVRRRKGLSLSEVARGAGLTRRELNSYEKGRVPVPDSDLFVLAGSCGVDVSELRPAVTTPALAAPTSLSSDSSEFTAAPADSSIQDTVARLRPASEPAPEIAVANAPTVSRRRRQRALAAAAKSAAGAPTAVDSQSPTIDAAWPIEHVDPLEVVQWPTDASITPPLTSTAPSPAEPVDVFEELARLPEPVALPTTDAQRPDLFAVGTAPPPPPDGAVEAVDDEWSSVEWDDQREAPAAIDERSEPVLVEMPNATQTMVDLTNAADAPPIDVAMRGESFVTAWDALQSRPTYDTRAGDTRTDGTRTDDSWLPSSPTWDMPPTEPPSGASTTPDAPAFGTWDVETAAPSTTDPFGADPSGETTRGWTHDPDPEATSTGFFVDWGSDSAIDTEPALSSRETLTPRPVGDHQPSETGDFEEVLPVINWRPVSGDSPTLVSQFNQFAPESFVLAHDEPATHEPAPYEPAPPESGPELHEDFVVAGADWELGNAVPLVEVRNTGSLVMRRADERWALADVTADSNFTVEAYVDLRSGPGFGVLFRAEVDGDGRMSGYSFDVDPVYEGGGYLVRQWRADRELWNPIAQVAAPNPGAMRGLLAVRLTVDDDRLVASVNGDVVLEVECLKQASADRGREGASGNRVGIQAWSSTDLVIDELRVASH